MLTLSQVLCKYQRNKFIQGLVPICKRLTGLRPENSLQFVCGCAFLKSGLPYPFYLVQNYFGALLLLLNYKLPPAMYILE